MPFQKGSSGNPAGRPAGRRAQRWISDRERFIQAQRSFASLVKIRDGEILERKVIGKNETGEPITVDIVASIRDLIVCNDKILNRTIGLPRVEDGETDGNDRAALFLAFLRELLTFLAAEDQTALQYLEIHVRNFADRMKLNGALPTNPTGVAANHR